jgi:hypothetical protein
VKLPPPFDNATDVKANPDGTINLIDYMGKALARIPLSTAFELSPEAEGYGYADGHGHGDGGGFGSSFGSGSGYGYGQSYGQTDGSGLGNSK